VAGRRVVKIDSKEEVSEASSPKNLVDSVPLSAGYVPGNGGDKRRKPRLTEDDLR
jgi:hypothetical protein